ncbi:MAG: fumarylacetoacetate hydrolase family protein, partial [Myxococcota bacterium]
GYANANDLSERAWQFRSSQWLLGKSFDHALPIGPYLVTADEISDPSSLAIRGWRNGELRQDSHTSDMIFSVPEVVSYISRYISLAPGDIISTGTPPGVILGQEEKKWMRPGDEYSVEITGLGRLSNRLR